MHAEEELQRLLRRVEYAQQLANMGDYDWHIPTNTNRWSNQLYRIYGYEPQSLNMSYEVFLSHVHPDDRERIAAVHRHSYATGEPYEMIERIVRPDGEVRHLSSNGQVFLDEDGTPVRMRGTCIDITDRVIAEQGREREAAKLGEARARKRQAVEINDSVVQGLTAALYALELGDATMCELYLQRTLTAAREMMTDLVAPLSGEDASPGDLVRTSPAVVSEARPGSARG